MLDDTAVEPNLNPCDAKGGECSVDETELPIGQVSPPKQKGHAEERKEKFDYQHRNAQPPTFAQRLVVWQFHHKITRDQ